MIGLDAAVQVITSPVVTVPVIAALAATLAGLCFGYQRRIGTLRDKLAETQAEAFLTLARLTFNAATDKTRALNEQAKKLGQLHGLATSILTKAAESRILDRLDAVIFDTIEHTLKIARRNPNATVDDVLDSDDGADEYFSLDELKEALRMDHADDGGTTLREGVGGSPRAA